MSEWMWLSLLHDLGEIKMQLVLHYAYELGLIEPEMYKEFLRSWAKDELNQHELPEKEEDHEPPEKEEDHEPPEKEEDHD